jgi:hypothetical protein
VEDTKEEETKLQKRGLQLLSSIPNASKISTTSSPRHKYMMLYRGSMIKSTPISIR